MSSSGSHQGSVVRVSRLAAFAAALALSIACAGGGDQQGADTGAGATPGGTQGQPGGAAGDFNEQSITPQMIALGDSIFRGQAANGICYTCHGPDANGTALAPSLRDSAWLNTDGSLGGIANTVRTGVLQPKQFPAPMPAQGPPVLSEEQVRAVASYVYSLTHPNVGSKSGN